MTRDTRPVHSPAPADARSIILDAQDELGALIRRAIDGVAALPGVPAERENDALSAAAHLATFAAAELVANLMIRKEIKLGVALVLAENDIRARLTAILVEAVAPGGGPR